MKRIAMVVVFCASGCATHVGGNSSSGKIDRCMGAAESKQYLDSQFSHSLETELATSGVGRMAVVLSAAIDGRFGRHIGAAQLSEVLLRKSGAPNQVSFLHVKEVVQELGYGALAWKGGNQDYRKYKKVMALSVDGTFNPLIISGVENDIVHTVYSSGVVCQMDYSSFKDASKMYPIMFFTSKS